MVTTARRWDGTQWVNATVRRWDGTGWVTIHDPDPDPDPDPLPDLNRINIGSGEWGPEACLVDDLRLYPTALTAQQIQDDMSTPL